MGVSAKCPGCGRRVTAPDEYAGQPTKCLSCGAEFELPMRPDRPGLRFSLRSLLLWTFLLMTVLVIGGYGIKLTRSAGRAWQERTVSLSEYMQLADGMSYAQATKVLGMPGIETASGNMPGVPGIMPSINTKCYSWQNPGGSNILLTFQNDRLIMKAQAGLR